MTRIKVSTATSDRVAKRIAVNNRPYIAHRRDFTTPVDAAFSLAMVLRKVAIWQK